MSDKLKRIEDNSVGVDEVPIVVPPTICAQALRFNQFSIVGVLVNPKKQKMRDLIYQMPRVWGLSDGVTGRIIDKRKFQFVFHTEEAMNFVLQGGPWSFAEWMIVTQRCDAMVTTNNMFMIALWVQIRGIPPQYLSREMIDFIGDKLGRVLEIPFDDTSNLTDFVRVRVNWNINKCLCFQRIFQFANGEKALISFVYERVWNYCLKCGMLTHDEEDCPLGFVDDEPNGIDDDIDCNTDSVNNEGRGFFTDAFSGRGMIPGRSGGVAVPKSYVPFYDRDLNAETSRYVKAKYLKGKYLLRDDFNLSQTTGSSQRDNFADVDHYNPVAADAHLTGKQSNPSDLSLMSSTWPVYEGTEAVYHPMEKYSPINVFPDKYTDEGLSVGVVCGGKRKRDDDVMYNSATLVNVESTIKVEECESVDSCENL